MRSSAHGNQWSQFSCMLCLSSKPFFRRKMTVQVNTKVKGYQVHSIHTMERSESSSQLKIYIQDIQTKKIYVALNMYNRIHYLCKCFTILTRELFKVQTEWELFQLEFEFHAYILHFHPWLFYNASNCGVSNLQLVGKYLLFSDLKE